MLTDGNNILHGRCRGNSLQMTTIGGLAVAAINVAIGVAVVAIVALAVIAKIVDFIVAGSMMHHC